MNSLLMSYEFVQAIQRERQMAGAPRYGYMVRNNGNSSASARYVIGNALVRVGRSLQGDAAPRPEPAGHSLNVERDGVRR